MDAFYPMVGMWVIYAGEVELIARVVDGRCSIDNGTRSIGGINAESLFPLTLANKSFAENVMAWEKRARYGDGRRYPSKMINHSAVQTAFLRLHDQCLSIDESLLDERNAILLKARVLSEQISKAATDAMYV